MQPADYYKTLNIPPDATTQAIRKAFRRLALKYHPDRAKDDPEAAQLFKQILKAYEVLNDPEARAVYNNLRKYGPLRASSFSQVPSEPAGSRIIIEAEERVVQIGEPFRLSIYVQADFEEFRIHGLGQFKIIEGPDIITVFGETKEKAKVIHYTLEPLQTGYIAIGPVSILQTGFQWVSDNLFLKVKEYVPREKAKTKSQTETLLLLLAGLFILSFSSLIVYNFLKDPHRGTTTEKLAMGTPAARGDEQLATGLSPYSAYFGEPVYAASSHNEIIFETGSFYDAVVCLRDIETNKCVRNTYIQAGDQYRMQQIPDGDYYLQVYFGNDWNWGQPLNNGALLGGFSKNPRYEMFKQTDQLLQMHQYRRADTLYYSVYKITLYPLADGNILSRKIDSQQFFN